jgi:hypothetical protein
MSAASDWASPRAPDSRLTEVWTRSLALRPSEPAKPQGGAPRATKAQGLPSFAPWAQCCQPLP